MIVLFQMPHRMAATAIRLVMLGLAAEAAFKTPSVRPTVS